MKTDNLIGVLALDITAPPAFGRILRLAVGAGSILAMAAFLAVLRPRPDLVEAVGTVRFVFKFVVTLTLGLAAIGLLGRVARPGSPVGAWPWLIGVVPALLGAAVLSELVVVPANLWGTRLVGSNAVSCLTLIPIIAVGPLVCLLLALREGAPSHPGRAGAVAGLAASGIAATLYASHCPDDSPLFVATWYVLATAVVVAAGAWAGSRLLRT